MSCATKSRKRHCSPCSLFWGDIYKGINAESFTLQKKHQLVENAEYVWEMKNRIKKKEKRDVDESKELQFRVKEPHSLNKLSYYQDLFNHWWNQALILPLSQCFFFLDMLGGRFVCFLPQYLWFEYALLSLFSQGNTQFRSSLWFQRNSPVFKKSRVSTNEPLSYFSGSG